MFYLFITIFGYFYKVDQLDKISQLKVNILLLYSAQIKREGLGPAPPPSPMENLNLLTPSPIPANTIIPWTSLPWNQCMFISIHRSRWGRERGTGSSWEKKDF